MNDIISGIMSAAGHEPGRTALVDGRGREITYGELARRVTSVREAMSGGRPARSRRTVSHPGSHPGGGALQPGDGVLFAVRPGVDAVVLALGSVAAGGTLVLADPGLAPDVLAARMAATRPAWVVAESLLYTLSGPLKGLARRRGLLLPNLRDPLPGTPVRHLHTGPWLPGVPRGALRLSRILRAGLTPRNGADTADRAAGRAMTDRTVTDRAVTEQAVDRPADATADRTATDQAAGRTMADQAAAVIFTSGTTARPRGVVHTRGSLAAGLELFRSAFPLGPGDVVHTDQLMLGLPALMAGATWSLPGGGDLAVELAERRATHTFAVPVHLDRLLRRTPRLPQTLRYLLLGAAPAPPGVLRRAVEAGPEVLSVYAMTEALPIAVASAREKLAHAEGDLLGTPLPGVGVRVADDGELFVSGPHLARRYLGEEPLREVATGDLVRLDGDRLVLLGRKKDMILRDGVNIYPGLYESGIAALPGVAEAAIVGLADPETGDEEVVLAVIPTGDYDEGLLRGALPRIVDAAALPDRIEALDAFPRSGRADKLDRAALRAMVARRD
ncbi:acyl-CoA synthetase (AMP-forming)/AMP-acid ligase II [Streptosporangium becharense]|uniref:Acyl-CoA synthetase (AMP-forming)/AMP-acid ligase II n=1 Tax=Streptosporangium becharense TaxID=1816182 RepID=A0A7W9IH01_9ACTN|nr:class I adenylate-forming enzyme family protein [Streptosporangium becharense]MBB2912634.1 acyl-CoA synthetase (AMP-forming)/AMP-acid ligase II [Streptosporangium becharense]MBB5820537.1 acyl-CoA synthetase (AMP-forming)/AMP-acid ligase II [Streptosporangium becharense]